MSMQPRHVSHYLVNVLAEIIVKHGSEGGIGIAKSKRDIATEASGARMSAILDEVEGCITCGEKIAHERRHAPSGDYQIHRNNSNQQVQLRPCPVCRGYELERRWCGRCDGRGVLEVRHE